MYKLVGLDAAVAPAGIEFQGGVGGDDFGFGFAFVDQLLNAAADGGDHVAVGFDVCAFEDLAMGGDDVDLIVGPAVQHFDDAVELAVLLRIDFGILSPGKTSPK